MLLLGYYYCRIPNAPPLLRLLLFFIIGAISGFCALSIEWIFETVFNWLVNWQQIQGCLATRGCTSGLVGVALRQLVEIGPIEEGCKLMGVIVPTCYLQRRYRLLPATIFLFTIAVALGFTAQENCIYIFHGTASILDRSIGTPVHAMFSAPWGYALAIYISSTIRLHRDRKLVPWAWLNAVICHALINVLSGAWRYSPPLHYLSYGLFPLLLWMFWRLEQLLRRVQGKTPIILISGYTPQHCYWQKGLVLFALILGGNAIFGLFILARQLSPLHWSQILDTEIIWFALRQVSQNLVFGILAWVVYRYLRHSACRRYF